MTTDLLERRAATKATIEALERDAGAAVLDGKPFDHSALEAARRELEALDAAEGEKARRERAVNVDAKAVGRAAAAVTATQALKDYALAIVDIEAASRVLIAGIIQARCCAAELTALSPRLGIQSPNSVNVGTVDMVLSRLIAASLDGLGSRSHFGHLKWPSVPGSPAWSDHFTKHIEPAFLSAIQGETE